MLNIFTADTFQRVPSGLFFEEQQLSPSPAVLIPNEIDFVSFILFGQTGTGVSFYRYDFLEVDVKQNSSDTISFFMVDSANPPNGLTGATPTILMKKAGGSFASPAGSYVEKGYGWYDFVPGAGDYDTLGELLFHVTATGAYDLDFKAKIVERIESETYDLVATTNSLSQLLRQELFEYKGNAGNIFSKVRGSFTGTIHFHTISMANFTADSNSPPETGGVLDNRICSLTSSGVMTNTAGLATDGEIIFMALENFVAISDIIVNYYCNYTKGNIRFYIPRGVATVNANDPYYPTAKGILLREQGSATDVTPFADSVYADTAALIPLIDWDKVVVPLVIDQSSVAGESLTRMIVLKDRDYSVNFDLARDVTGNSIYFAIKNDRKSDYYDIEPYAVTINNEATGDITLDITYDKTSILDPGKYYGELLMLVPGSPNQYISLQLFEVEIRHSIIDTRDV